MSLTEPGYRLDPSPASPATPAGAPRRGKVVLGVLAIVAGVIGAVVLWLAADQRLDDGVDALARAPVGCETVLDFDETGEFLLFAETEGRFDEVRGDCAAQGPFRADVENPTVEVDVSDPDGEPVAVRAAGGVTYDVDAATGTQVGVMTVTEPGDHLVRVASEDGIFALAVGQDPRDGVFLLRVAALVVLAVGVVLGVALISWGRRGARPGGPPPGRRVDPVRWEPVEPVAGPPQRPIPPPHVPGQPPVPGWGAPPRAPQPSPAEDSPPVRAPWAPPEP